MLNNIRLKDLREKLGLTQEEVGKVVGVSRSAVQKYEKGIIGNVNVSTVELFGKALQCNPAYLLGWVDNPDIEVMPDDVFILTQSEKQIVSQYRELNQEGQEKAVAYLDDLTASGRYKKDNFIGMGKKAVGEE